MFYLVRLFWLCNVDIGFGVVLIGVAFYGTCGCGRFFVTLMF